MARGDRYRSQAAEAEASATKATSPEIKREYLALAAQWRDLAREADAYEDARQRASAWSRTRPKPPEG